MKDEILLITAAGGGRPTGVQQEEKLLPRHVAPDDSESDPTKRKYAKEKEQEEKLLPPITEPKTDKS